MPVQPSAPVPPSRPFDVHIWSDHPQLEKSSIPEIVRQIEAWETLNGIRKRKRTDKEAKRFAETVKALVLDLYVAWTQNPFLTVGIDLNANAFAKQTRYDKLKLDYRQFKAAYEALEGVGLIETVQTGFYDRQRGIGRNTKIRAKKALIALIEKEAPPPLPSIGRNPDRETVILKISKVLSDYQDTVQTYTWRFNLLFINEELERHWYDIDLTQAEWDDLQCKLSDDPQKGAINLTHRTLHRIFTDRFDQHGRFYGGWWQSLPKAYRPFILINGKLTVELDFSGLHPTMLYAQRHLRSTLAWGKIGSLASARLGQRPPAAFHLN